MRKILVCIFLGVVLTSCFNRENPIVTINNESSISLDSVLVYPVGFKPTVFKKVNPSDYIKGKIYFSKDEDTIFREGGYIIKLYADGKLINQKGFGYFTGISLDDRFDITIKNDAIIVKN